MTNTSERAHYYSVTEACSLGKGTWFGFYPAQWEANLMLLVFKANQTIAVGGSGLNTTKER